MIRKEHLLVTGLMVCLTIGISSATGVYAADEQTVAKTIIDASGVKAGLCVHVGCGDGRLTAELGRTTQLLVQGVSSDRKEVTSARNHVQSEGLYGKVSIAECALSRLPYADNMVNLIVIDDLASQLKAGLSIKEVIRVLCPNGVLVVRGVSETDLKAKLASVGGNGMTPSKLDSVGAKVVKPRPAEMDDWTHFSYDAGNNNVSQDRAFGPLQGLRWIFGPPAGIGNGGRYHTVAVASSGGRLFYITWSDPVNRNRIAQGISANTLLLARDAYNGLRLWTRHYPFDLQWPTLEEMRAADASQKYALSTRSKALFKKLRYFLVTNGDRVYTVLDGDVVALDGATGKTILTYPQDPSVIVKQLKVHDNVLIVRDDQKRLWMFDASTAKRLWKHPPLRTGRGRGWGKRIAAGDGRMFILTYVGENPSKRMIVSFDLKTGKEIWRVETTRKRNGQLYFQNEVLSHVGNTDDGMCLTVHSVKSGDLLWETTDVASGGLLTGKLIWVDRYEPGSGSAKKERFSAFLDPLTGVEKRRIPFTRLTKGCFKVNPHTVDYRIGTRPPNIVSRKDGKLFKFEGGRHACEIGVLIGNGLLYSMPQGCACVPNSLKAFVAFAPAGERDKDAQTKERPALWKGPAYGKTPNHQPSTINHLPSDWPTYRHDARRTCSTQVEIPVNLVVLWKAAVPGAAAKGSLLADSLKVSWAGNPWGGGDGLTSPVVADGRIFVGVIDTHRVVAFDAKTGKHIWSYTVNGRLNTSPTIYGSLCLLGAADGFVYCLRATDGRLVWRYRAAPREEQIIAHGQLESKWPVLGGVLVKDGVAHCVAGRSSAVDGGMYHHQIDPLTGKSLSVQKTENINDLLVSDGTGKISLISTLPGRSLRKWRCWLDRSWQAAAHKPWRWKLMGADPSPVEEFVPKEEQGKGKRKKRKDTKLTDCFWLSSTGRISVGADSPKRFVEYRPHLSMSKPYRGTWDSLLLAWEGEDRRLAWHLGVPHPLQVESMLLAQDKLLVAGPLDIFRPSGKGFLWLLSMQDGKKLGEWLLPGGVVTDGAAAASGRIYVSTRDGKVVCYGK